MNRIKYWFKYKFPWVILKRAAYNSDVLKARIDGERQANSQILEKEKLLNDLLPKLFRVSASRGQEYGTYQCVVRFNTGLVESMFEHGNSQREIEYISRMLAHHVERELHTINFARIPR